MRHPFNEKKASMAAALCYGARGGGAQLCFDVTAGNYDTDRLIEVLKQLRRFLGGEKATLLWDGLPSHRSTAIRNWIRTQRSWLVVERRPPTRRSSTRSRACGPTSRPWSWPHQGIERVRRTLHLAYSFLRRTGLSVS